MAHISWGEALHALAAVTHVRSQAVARLRVPILPSAWSSGHGPALRL